MELFGFGLAVVVLVIVGVTLMQRSVQSAPGRRTGRSGRRDGSDGVAVYGATDDHRHHDSRTPDSSDSNSADSSSGNSATSDSGSSGDGGGGE